MIKCDEVDVIRCNRVRQLTQGSIRTTNEDRRRIKNEARKRSGDAGRDQDNRQWLLSLMVSCSATPSFLCFHLIPSHLISCSLVTSHLILCPVILHDFKSHCFFTYLHCPILTPTPTPFLPLLLPYSLTPSQPSSPIK
jgi:hypothetical protein